MKTTYILLLRDRIVVEESKEMIDLLVTNQILYSYDDEDLIIRGYASIYKALYYINDEFNIILN